MKNFLISILLVAVLTISAFAIEAGDYGYYDTTKDGKIEIVDVLGTLHQVLNDDNGGSLLRVIRTLKLSANGKLIYPAITAIDKDAGTVSLTLATSDKNVNFTMPINKIGFDESLDTALYVDGIVTMTASASFETAKDTSLIYAAEASCRYDTVKTEFDSFANAELLAKTFEATVEISNGQATFIGADGKTVTTQADDEGNVSTVVVAEGLDAYTSINETTGKVTTVKQFLPFVFVTDASGKAGDEIEVTVALTHNPGIAGLQINLGYDADVLSFASGKTVSNGMYAQVSTTEGANPAKIVMANMSLKNIAGDLTLATLKFKISEEAVAGTYSLIYEQVQIYDKEIYGLKTSTNPCYITVEE